MGARGYACCDLYISGIQNIDIEVSLGRTNGLRHDRVNSGPFLQTFKTLPGINDRGGYRGPEVTICSGTQGTSDPLCCLFLKRYEDVYQRTSRRNSAVLVKGTCDLRPVHLMLHKNGVYCLSYLTSEVGSSSPSINHGRLPFCPKHSRRSC